MELDLGISNRLKKSMQRLGLTEYESRAYIILLSKGEATAIEISRDGGIPYSKIYETLSELEEKGWIVSEKGRPTKYRPQPPAIAVETVKNKLINELSELSNLVVSELSPIYEKRTDREKPDLWIIRGEENLWRRIREVIGRANRHLCIAIPYIPKDLQQIMLPIVSFMRERGGSVQILVGEGCDYNSVKKLTEISEVRIRDISLGGGVISDVPEVVLLLMGGGDKRPKLGIYSAHIGLTSIIQNYFDVLWATSSPIKPRLSSS